MKKCLLLFVLFTTFYISNTPLFAQSTTLAPNYIVIPGVAALPSCANLDKGKTVFNTTDKKMYYCDGTAWQGMAGVPSAGVGWSQTGADINNTNTGSVTVNSATNKATNAIFGSNGTGISLQKSNPAIGFNQYRDGTNAQRIIGDGHAMSILFAPFGGSMVWNSNPSGLAGSLTSSETSLMTLSNNGRLGIGVGDDIPAEKLTIGTAADNYGMLHTAGGRSVGSYVSSVGGAFGTKSNHPFSLFANNSAAALTIRTNSDVEISKGLYAPSLGGLNMVPLGVINVSYSIDGNTNLQNLSIINKAGNLALGTHFFTSINSSDDISYLSVYLNNTLLSGYSSVVLVGSPMFDHYNNAYINVAYAKYFSTPNPGINIIVGSDNFSNCEVNGDYIIYGIR